MKLMLTSDGICHAVLKQELLKLLEGEPSKTAACILTTASSHKEQSRGAVQTRELFHALGFARTEFIDIEFEDPERLRDYDVIYLNGGNPFYLLYWLRRSHAIPILRELAEMNKVIIGTSAGAMILGPSIGHVTQLNRIAGYEPMADELDDYQAVGITNINVVPHYNRFAAEDVLFETKLQKLEADHQLIFERIKDGEAILLNGKADTGVHIKNERLRRMIMNLNIEQVTSIEQYKEPLSDLLIQVVEQGASVGFLPPLAREAASSYWNGVLNPEAILWIAKLEGRVIGTVQLHLCGKPNGRHRAEIAKLMTLPDYQRQGIGRALMQEAEHRARREGRSLLVLDTRDGDPSNRLYTSIGYILAGQIPCFAKSADGGLDATNLYYKKLDIE